MASHPLPPGRIIAPNYDGYFERLEESSAASWVEPKLVVEGARGCWWGEKHHCTFCGLNGSFMQFRSKSPAVFAAEVIDLVERYQVLDMYVVDNILDMSYLSSFLPTLAEIGHDLRLQYEIKSNLRRHQLQILADAGLVNVQPGIENLSSRVLKLMDKGVTGCQNVRLLRDAATVGIGMLWSYLYGFPGETVDDYLDVIAQIPALHHLNPCLNSTRIAIERFSPYFNRPELGFADLRPADQYALIYDLPDRELFDLAYLFEAPPCGIDEQTAARLDEAVAEWRDEFLLSQLSYCDLGEDIVLVSRRKHFDWSVLRLHDPVERAAFRLLDQPHSPEALVRKLHAQPDVDTPIGAEDVTSLLRRWRALGIVFEDDGHVVHVVPEVSNSDVIRVDPARITGLASQQASPQPV